MIEKGTCKYYNGDHHNEQCLAGVAYRDVTTDPDNRFGIAFRKPCIKWHEKWVDRESRVLSATQQAEYSRRGTCAKYTEPTAEEIAVYEAEHEAHMQKFLLTLPLIQKVKKEHAGQQWKGAEQCPACQGNLHMTHSGYNGHVWGKCETEGCLSWME